MSFEDCYNSECRLRERFLILTITVQDSSRQASVRVLETLAGRSFGFLVASPGLGLQ